MAGVNYKTGSSEENSNQSSSKDRRRRKRKRRKRTKNRYGGSEEKVREEPLEEQNVKGVCVSSPCDQTTVKLVDYPSDSSSDNENDTKKCTKLELPAFLKGY